MHVGKRKEKNQYPAPPLQSIQRQEEPLFCAVSHTRSLIQTLIRMDGSSPPRDWKKAWNYLSREGSSPENCQNCRLDEQKRADDKFFRTTLRVPVVADCEIMCWPFGEHALLIWVCLVVYKKHTLPPPPPCHHPSPPESSTASSKRCWRDWLLRGREDRSGQVGAKGGN